jgi:hypothetical protein
MKTLAHLAIAGLVAGWVVAAAALAGGVDQPNSRAPLSDPAAAQAAFETIVERAIETCRKELRDDIFGNFRLEACVEQKVAAAVEEIGAPALDDMVQRNPNLLLVGNSG